jgi:3-isopropylmalate dehydratase small subunit
MPPRGLKESRQEVDIKRTELSVVISAQFARMFFENLPLFASNRNDLALCF